MTDSGRCGLFPSVGEGDHDVPIRQIGTPPRLPSAQIVMPRRDHVGKVWPVTQFSPKRKDPPVRFEPADVLLSEAASQSAGILRTPVGQEYRS
jgi:hypothetical protein